MSDETRVYETDVAIIGGGIAGIVCAIELLDADLQNGTQTRILMLDRDEEGKFGGLARESFGGILLVDTKEQRRAGVKDSVELALQDWLRFGELDTTNPEHRIPIEWATAYVTHCKTEVYQWLRKRGISFLPLPLWVERGQNAYGPNRRDEDGPTGNSVPRWHIVWGTGSGLTTTLIQVLRNHPLAGNITTLFGHYVTELVPVQEGGEGSSRRVEGCLGVTDTANYEQAFRVRAKQTVVAAGGINGSESLVRKHWHADWSPAPATILNGAHPYADGTMHEAVRSIGGNLTFLDRMWNYAAGVHHWNPDRPNHGLSLVPTKSALWVDAHGKRIMPPMVTGFDTRELVRQVCQSPEGRSWQILNRTIAKKEFAISGSDFNRAFREKSYYRVAKQMLFGNGELVDEVTNACIDIVTATTLEDLVAKMNALPMRDGDHERVDLVTLTEEIGRYDAAIERGRPFEDEQLQRIEELRKWRGDKVRTCNNQKINDPKAGPLMAIRLFIVSRKSLGGIETDLDARVLTGGGQPLYNLYAIGEAAGFGGGGMNGLRGLEGTFLGGCIYSGRRAGAAIHAALWGNEAL